MTDYHNCLEQEIPRLRRYARALTRNAARADDLLDPPSANDCANRRPEAGAPPRALTFEAFVRALLIRPHQAEVERGGAAVGKEGSDG